MRSTTGSTHLEEHVSGSLELSRSQEEEKLDDIDDGRGLPTDEPSTLSLDPTDIKKQAIWDPNYTTSPTGPDDPSFPNSSYSENSPYPEVSASVHPSDDVNLPASTVRAWLLGILFSILLPGINQFFFYRYPNVQVQGIIAQLMVHPLGMALARLPADGWWRWINPGEWNAKEHTVVYIMANVSASSAYATNVIATQRFFYNHNWGWGYSFLLVFSTQLLGFAFAGPLQRILVRPASMIWPSTLVNCTLFNTLHPQTATAEATRTARSRQTFFYIQAIAMFVWSWLPGYLFTALSVFDWVTWIKPRNQIVNLLFGYQSGAGMSLLTLDWGMMASINNPLATPWWTIANILGGFVLFIWVIAPILYYTNVFHSKWLPFSSGTIFDNKAQPYQLHRTLGQDGRFDVEAYRAYSPVYMTITMALGYGLSFAAVTATVVHTILFFRHQISSHLRPIASDIKITLASTAYLPWRKRQPFLTPPTPFEDRDTDIHARLMSQYPSVPGWWYSVLFILTLVLSIIVVKVWPTELPIWALFMALLISTIMVVPVGMIQAITNHQVPLNVITELVVGYLVPGKPVAMMVFKTYGYITTTQCLAFVSDQKLAHYMHVPPRLIFMAQLVGAGIGAVTQLSVQEWLFANVDGICEPNQPHWWCPSTRTFFSASILFGILPARLFSPTSATHIYSPLLIFFPIGAILPVVTYFLARRYPHSIWKYVCWPVVFSCVSLLPPYLPINFISFCMIGFVFQWYLRRKRYLWWSRYNYILSAAWTCGYALCVVAIFFTLQLPRNGEIGQEVQKWWGNIVYTKTLDAQGGSAAAALHLQPGETYGLAAGTWS